jgi:Protein of unknown function (DUF1364).
MIRSKKILRSAKGAQCALRLPGICNNDPATTVWAHLNGFGKGMGMKTHDILGFPACSSCHTEYDTGKNRSQYTGDALRALCETLVSLVLSGLVIVPLDAETPASERPTPPRKPRAQRAKVPSNPNHQWPSRPMKSANTLRRKENNHG